eukprot:3764948-Rhodomonas_salina.3
MAEDQEELRKKFTSAMDLRVNPLRLPSEEMSALPSSEHAASLAQACDTQKNAQDVHGNGDQKPLLPETPDWDKLNSGTAQVSPALLARMMNNPSEHLRKAWASGADFGPSNLSSFRWACYVGNAEIVEQGLAMVEGSISPIVFRIPYGMPSAHIGCAVARKSSVAP